MNLESQIDNNNDDNNYNKNNINNDKIFEHAKQIQRCEPYA